MLQNLAEKWMLVKLTHKVSKAASDLFWEHAMSLRPPIMDVKNTHGITRKIPKFIHERRKLKRQQLPSIQHQIAYKNDGGDVVVVGD